MRTTLTALAAVVALTVTGCGDGDDTAEEAPSGTPSATEASPGDAPAGSQTPTQAPTYEGTSQAVRIQGDQVAPSAKRIDLGVGERLLLTVTSDRAGELHVHSAPEQELAFDQGRTTLDVVVRSPGLVEVEEHESGAVILRLYVS